MLKTVVLALAMAAVAVQAASLSVPDVLKKEGLTLALELGKLANADKALASEEATVTILAPTNEAIEAFLKEMGITVDYLKEHEALADVILAYHLVVGVTAGPKEFFAESDKVIVSTAAYPYNITVTKTETGVTVTDFQGNVANVVKADLGHSKNRVHVIDKVLYSGAYWPNLKKLVKTMPGYFSTAEAAAEKAGLSLTPKDSTIFLPINSAFKKAGITLDADAATLKNVLLYHVVEGDRTIPKGFVSGEKVKTLEGQDIIVTYEESDKKVTDNMVDATAYVTDARGNKILVVHPNLFVSSNEVQVVDGVLLPKAETAPAATTTTAAATTTTAAATTKPATTTTTTTTTATYTKPAVSVPAPATFTITHPFIQGKGVKFTVNFGRKLMQQGSGARQYAPTISLDSASQSILNAVNNDASMASTQAASAGNIANALVLTRYPVHATYADGITGSIAAIASGGN